MSKKIIHVNRNLIDSNRKNDTNFPVIVIEEGKTKTYCTRVKVLGPSEFFYLPESPLSCGARAWIETEADLEIENPTTYAEIKKQKI